MKVIGCIGAAGITGNTVGVIGQFKTTLSSLLLGGKYFDTKEKRFVFYICGNICAIGWVESNIISLSILLVVVVVTVWQGLQGFVLNGLF